MNEFMLLHLEVTMYVCRTTQRSNRFSRHHDYLTPVHCCIGCPFM